MSIFVIIIVVVVIVAAVAAMLVMNPILQKKGEEAIAKAKAELGGDSNVIEIEPKAVGLLTEPAEAGTAGGQGVLAVSATDLVFVTWSKQEVMKVPRSTITDVACSAEDPGAVSKATIIVSFTHGGSPAKAQFRVSRDLVNWLTALGYDWGPSGPPVPGADDDDL